MNLKISRCCGLVFPVLLASTALTACGEKATNSQAPLAVALLRYNANGTPDTSLTGGSGLVTTDVNPSQNDLGFAVLLQSDGRIIAVGNTFTTQASVAVIRYNA